jgi:hypothetical protein
MNLKHRFFFHGSRKNGRSKNKNHAQDGGTLIEPRDQRPAILPWFRLSDGVHPCRQITGTLPVESSRRIAAGRFRLSTSLAPSCPVHEPFEPRTDFRKTMQKTRACRARALQTKLNDECCAFR